MQKGESVQRCSETSTKFRSHQVVSRLAQVAVHPVDLFHHWQLLCALAYQIPIKLAKPLFWGPSSMDFLASKHCKHTQNFGNTLDMSAEAVFFSFFPLRCCVVKVSTIGLQVWLALLRYLIAPRLGDSSHIAANI